MFTLTLIALLIFVPATRSAHREMVSGIFSLLGLALLISRDSGGAVIVSAGRPYESRVDGTDLVRQLERLLPLLYHHKQILPAF